MLGTNFVNMGILTYCGGYIYEHITLYLIINYLVDNCQKNIPDVKYSESTPDYLGILL